MLSLRRIRVAGIALWVTAFGCGSEPATSEAPPRSSQLLSAGWRFLASDAAGAEAPEFDDAAAGWNTVSIPHTWNALDGQDGGGDYYRGPGWYRVRLPQLSLATGERAYLQFEGANTVADVYLNGTHLGQHRGGFSTFRF